MPGARTHLAKLLIRTDLLLCALTGALLYFFPGIDLWISKQFFIQGKFLFDLNPLVQFIYHLFARLHVLLLALFICGLIVLSCRYGKHAKVWRKRIWFLLLVLVIVPGLLVNTGLKNNSFGRPRPLQVEEFGGTLHFAPVFTYSGECATNCSFVSGHAAFGFYFISFGYLLKRRTIFFAGFAVGVLVGVARIVQGAHFLSDVVFSFWVVYFGTLIIARLFNFSLTPQLAVNVVNQDAV